MWGGEGWGGKCLSDDNYFKLRNLLCQVKLKVEKIFKTVKSCISISSCNFHAYTLANGSYSGGVQIWGEINLSRTWWELLTYHTEKNAWSHVCILSQGVKGFPQALHESPSRATYPVKHFFSRLRSPQSMWCHVFLFCSPGGRSHSACQVRAWWVFKQSSGPG